MTELKTEDRPMIFTDLETATGFKDKLHSAFVDSGQLIRYCEILEIGAVKVNPKNLRIIGKLNIKTKPEFPDRVQPQATKVNGYNEKDWKDAVSLREGLEKYNAFAEGGVFWSDTPDFDYALMEIAWVDFQMPYPTHRKAHSVQDFVNGIFVARGYPAILSSFTTMGMFLNITEPKVHRGINGAMKAYKVYKKALTLPPAGAL